MSIQSLGTLVGAQLCPSAGVGQLGIVLAGMASETNTPALPGERCTTVFLEYVSSWRALLLSLPGA